LWANSVTYHMIDVKKRRVLLNIVIMEEGMVITTIREIREEGILKETRGKKRRRHLANNG